MDILSSGERGNLSFSKCHLNIQASLPCKKSFVSTESGNSGSFRNIEFARLCLIILICFEDSPQLGSNFCIFFLEPCWFFIRLDKFLLSALWLGEYTRPLPPQISKISTSLFYEIWRFFWPTFWSSKRCNHRFHRVVSGLEYIAVMLRVWKCCVNFLDSFFLKKRL